MSQRRRQTRREQERDVWITEHLTAGLRLVHEQVARELPFKVFVSQLAARYPHQREALRKG
jgi:hypothetical protein